MDIPFVVNKALVVILLECAVPHLHGCCCVPLQLLEYGYGCLAIVSRAPTAAFQIPADRLLEVGLQYEC